MRLFAALICLLSCLFVLRPARADVPLRPWNLQAYGLAARYHHAVGYLPGAGVGLAIERRIVRNQFAVAAGIEYTRAAQTLTLIEGSKEIHADLYQSFVAARAIWQPRRQPRLTFFLEMQTGLLLLHSRPWSFDAGAFGKIKFNPKEEAKLALGWGGGAAFRVGERMAVLLFVKQKFSRFAQRQSGVAAAPKVWRPYWNFAAGLSWRL